VKASRPVMSSDYGVPKNKTGLLEWSHVTKRMVEAMHYWICTVDSNGLPHATPVDGLWLDDALYFGGSPKTRRHRNLVSNPEVCVHLESALDVIILRGIAQEVRPVERELAVRLTEASKKKYGFGMSPEDYAKAGMWMLRPRVGLGWKNFPKDVTRWSA
jgi:hypothetical protein